MERCFRAAQEALNAPLTAPLSPMEGTPLIFGKNCFSSGDSISHAPESGEFLLKEPDKLQTSHRKYSVPD